MGVNVDSYIIENVLGEYFQICYHTHRGLKPEFTQWKRKLIYLYEDWLQWGITHTDTEMNYLYSLLILIFKMPTYKGRCKCDKGEIFLCVHALRIKGLTEMWFFDLLDLILPTWRNWGKFQKEALCIVHREEQHMNSTWERRDSTTFSLLDKLNSNRDLRYKDSHLTNLVVKKHISANVEVCRGFTITVLNFTILSNSHFPLSDHFCTSVNRSGLSTNLCVVCWLYWRRVLAWHQASCVDGLDESQTEYNKY